jgi:hypothetical protein
MADLNEQAYLECPVRGRVQEHQSTKPVASNAHGDIYAEDRKKERGLMEEHVRPSKSSPDYTPEVSRQRDDKLTLRLNRDRFALCLNFREWKSRQITENSWGETGLSYQAMELGRRGSLGLCVGIIRR